MVATAFAVILSYYFCSITVINAKKIVDMATLKQSICLENLFFKIKEFYDYIQNIFLCIPYPKYHYIVFHEIKILDSFGYCS